MLIRKILPTCSANIESVSAAGQMLLRVTGGTYMTIPELNMTALVVLSQLKKVLSVLSPDV